MNSSKSHIGSAFHYMAQELSKLSRYEQAIFRMGDRARQRLYELQARRQSTVNTPATGVAEKPVRKAPATAASRPQQMALDFGDEVRGEETDATAPPSTTAA